MDKVLQYINNLYTTSRIPKPMLDYDSDAKIKCSGCFTVATQNGFFAFQYRISTYRFSIATMSPVEKTEQQQYEKIYGEFIMREPFSKIAVWCNLLNWTADIDIVRQNFEYLLQPEINIKPLKRERNLNISHF